MRPVNLDGTVGRVLMSTGWFNWINEHELEMYFLTDSYALTCTASSWLANFVIHEASRPQQSLLLKYIHALSAKSANIK